MNNECGNKNGMYTCTLGRQHGGNHKDTVGGGVSWPNPFEPKPECPAKNNSYFCTRAKGHTGNHEARGANGQTLWHAWLDSAPKPKPDQHSVLFTLEDLKVLSFFMSKHGTKQAPETAAKIDKALKAAL